jgi:hypothetical protein
VVVAVVRAGEKVRFLFVSYVTSLNDENTSHKLAVVPHRRARECLRFKNFVTLFAAASTRRSLLHTGNSQSGGRKKKFAV